MRLLNWNILAGGGARTADIVQRIDRHAPDVCIISEYRAGPVGNILKAKMSDIGLPFHADASPRPLQNSVCIFSRSPLPNVEVPVVPHLIGKRHAQV